jgi:hypothetical protein
MSEHPKISFIITAWGIKRPRSLLTILSAIECQTIPEWEALVVDSDFTQDHFNYTLLDEERMFYFPKPLGKPHQHEEMYKASEWGAGKAFGEWLCFPNDDSYIVPQFAERMIQASEITNSEFVMCDMVHGRSDAVDPTGVHIYLSVEPHYGAIDKTSFIVRKKSFEKIGGFPMKYGWYGADGAFAEAVVSAQMKVSRISQPLVVHN